jgi:putative tricarboxylic transport membrane protein
MDFNETLRERLFGLIAPTLFIVLAAVLIGFVDEDPLRTESVTRGLFGPTAWPTNMLYLVIFFASGWLIQDLVITLWKYKPFSGKQVRSPAPLKVSPRKLRTQHLGADLRILAGIAIIGAYGYVIPVIGFAFATVIFLILWLVLGGITKATQIITLSTVGTIALLYLFVKLASMPLARGQGLFAEWTIALYRFLRIF